MPIAASAKTARKRASLARSALSASFWATTTAWRIASCSSSVRRRSASAYPAASAPCRTASLLRNSCGASVPAASSTSMRSRLPMSAMVRLSVSTPVKCASTSATPTSYAGVAENDPVLCSAPTRRSVKPPRNSSTSATSIGT
jgi:hypothetical protein